MPWRTTPAGGLRVVTEFLPRSASVAGRHYPHAPRWPRVPEHLPACRRPPALPWTLRRRWDAVGGGGTNAFTAKEHTCHYAHVLAATSRYRRPVADVVLNGRCAADESRWNAHVPRIAMTTTLRTPADMFLAALFGDHPVGRPVIGSAQSVSVMTRAHSNRFTCGVLPSGWSSRPPACGSRLHCVGPRALRPGWETASCRARVGRPGRQPLAASRDAEQTHVSLGIRTGRGAGSTLGTVGAAPRWAVA